MTWRIGLSPPLTSTRGELRVHVRRSVPSALAAGFATGRFGVAAFPK